ncbi:MAG: hypothetical protein KJO07_18335, partial [Deltaproteobacteria bacterium]|nr:hypothetical protein [Deltaproteobacteria bacterium]
MLHPDVELVGLSGEHLSNWWRVALPPGVWAGRWALVVRDQRGPVAVVKDRGRVELEGDQVGTSAAALAELRDELRVDLVVVADSDAMARLSSVAEPRAVRADDFVAQWLAVYDGLRRLRGKGIWSDP